MTQFEMRIKDTQTLRCKVNKTDACIHLRRIVEGGLVWKSASWIHQTPSCSSSDYYSNHPHPSSSSISSVVVVVILVVVVVVVDVVVVPCSGS